MPSWRDKFFDPGFYNPASPEAVRAASSEAAFMARALKLGKGKSLLDLACGPGRHSLEFARRGIRVTGLDITASYLALARREAARRGLEARFVRGDMRSPGFEAEFDAALCAFTSFGYFSKADDLKVLRGVRRALKPGGLFLIDVMDKTWLARNFRPRSWERREDGSFLLTEDRFDAATARLHGAWTVLRPGKPAQTRQLHLNLYDEAALGALMRRAGLAPLKRWRGFSARRGGDQSNRLVMLARRPA
ncbi:MAG: class I SAM-dependent methyltransferase [Elusimicrobia bacterium]|nr:class I SAM-dependent methyltransferase [Elusimicrobiota bacterium]